jgi:hypothetical protein
MDVNPAILWPCNLIVPGAGLIFLRREWLGFCLALIFALCANVGVIGYSIAPQAWPGWLVGLSTVLTCCSWVLAQVLCLLQWRTTQSYSHAQETEILNGVPAQRAIHRA